ncbi:hypothetical protein CAC42_3669 [Sphaceloma murrayae]|uniref:Uncharacterized protein n=1 Tax=Sphaceloma murrayae TaxID=2082308 RepID=A0A2K1QQ54_9PEZI|nr:hypothetical protein CAC42_3669 [Sphaceloma murrayae]
MKVHKACDLHLSFECWNWRSEADLLESLESLIEDNIFNEPGAVDIFSITDQSFGHERCLSKRTISLVSQAYDLMEACDLLPGFGEHGTTRLTKKPRVNSHDTDFFSLHDTPDKTRMRKAAGTRKRSAREPQNIS